MAAILQMAEERPLESLLASSGSGNGSAMEEKQPSRSPAFAVSPAATLRQSGLARVTLFASERDTVKFCLP